MKSLFTKSLLAVAVSFTLAACGSSGGGSSNEPETPAQPVNTETTQPVAAQPAEQPQPVANNNYIEGWRVSDGVINDIYQASRSWETETHTGSNSPISTFAESLGHDDEAFYGQDKGYYVDFQELAKQDGKAYLGFHSGTLKDEALHSDYTYAFVNEPYALYGVFTNANTGDPKAFALAYTDSKEKSNGIFSNGDLDTAGIPLSGTLTYKGEVVGAKTILKKQEHSYGRSAALVSPAQKDGTVELVVTLKGDNSRIKGTINSNSVGEIALTSVKTYTSGGYLSSGVLQGEAKTKDGKLTGEHTTEIYRINDPEKSTAIGVVSLTNAEKTEGYIGAFGAKRQ